jgi:CheY-like chemotaxis protein
MLSINERIQPNVARPIILLAEDNDDARRVYGLILQHYGYTVVEAIDGAEAIRLAREVRPNLVLMDIGLPRLDGWEASRILKSDDATAAIPLLAFSARVDSELDLAERCAFDGYILKPISPNELVRRVRAYLTMIGAERETNDPLPTPLQLERNGELDAEAEAAI